MSETKEDTQGPKCPLKKKAQSQLARFGRPCKTNFPLSDPQCAQTSLTRSFHKAPGEAY